MEYRNLGPTGLKVSVLSYGNWLTNDDPEMQNRTNEIVKKAWDSGINFFDTAEAYGDGQAEVQLGVALKNLNVPREQLVVSTKIFFGFPTKLTPNTWGLSRKHLVEGMKKCLKRLQLEYVDVVFAHRYDPDTPIEEICRGFNHLIKTKKAFYWGTSEWTAEQIITAIEVCDRLKLIRPIAEQCQYNMLNRDNMEVNLARIFDNYGYGTTVWSPLAGGILTGKYINEMPDGSRLATMEGNVKLLYTRAYMDPAIKPKRDEALLKLKKIAEEELNTTLPNLVLAWVIYHKDVSTAMVGASKVSQLEENLKAIDVMKHITVEQMKKINEALDTTPTPKTNFITFKPFAARR